MTDTMQAYLVEEDGDKVTGAVKTLEKTSLPAGEVSIKVEYSGINFKDAMVASGIGRMVRNYPHIPGVDLSGKVVSDSTGRFAEGDVVLVTGYALGVGSWGGYAEYANVSADWVVPMPQGLNTFEAMVLGTAGFTAMLAMMALEQNGVTPDKGDILVTGATGGVGSVAVEILSQAGYKVVASSGKPDMKDYLLKLGAQEVVTRSDVLDDSPKVLLKERWAGAVDNAGGKTLESLLRTMKRGGSVALTGNVHGNAFSTTVLPFILRGVNLLGIDSVECPMQTRLEAWRRLSSDLKPRHMEEIATVIGMADLPEKLKEIQEGGARGRYVLKIDG